MTWLEEGEIGTKDDPQLKDMISCQKYFKPEP